MAQPTKKQLEHRALVESVLSYFQEVEDPRVVRSRLHSLDLILTISLLAVIAGANGFVGIQRWAEAKEEWLKTFLDLSNGIPSHDTIGRVFAALDPAQLSLALQRWTDVLRGELGGDVVAIDGKALRRSMRRARSFIWSAPGRAAPESCSAK